MIIFSQSWEYHKFKVYYDKIYEKYFWNWTQGYLAGTKEAGMKDYKRVNTMIV